MNERVFGPLGITVGDTPTGGDHDLYWGFNYLDRPQQFNGINRRPFGAGIFCNVTAMARIGYLYLHRGRWQGKQIIPEDFVTTATTTAPGIETLPVADGLDWTAGASRHYGLLWWNNSDGAMAGVPRDAFWAYGMKESILAVVPSLDLVAVRAGDYLAPSEDPKRADTYNNLLKPFLLPICQSVARGAPYPPSPVITSITWTAVYYTEQWEGRKLKDLEYWQGWGESAHLPAKWMSADGKTVHLVFASGPGGFSIRRAELTVATVPN